MNQVQYKPGGGNLKDSNQNGWAFDLVREWYSVK